MLEKIVHWLIFAAVACFLLAALYQLITTGSVSATCCAIE